MHRHRDQTQLRKQTRFSKLGPPYSNAITILTDHTNRQVYPRVMKKDLTEECVETVANCNASKVIPGKGNQRLTDAADAEQPLRPIHSSPSPQAELFKHWVIKVGYESHEKFVNPTLAAQRMREIYRQKGSSADWIEKRIRGIGVHDDLTDERRRWPQVRARLQPCP